MKQRHHPYLFYNYLLQGERPNDEKLQLDDVVFIPKRKKTVSIRGEINRPGKYELIDNETIIDLIKMAGDLKVTAYIDRAQIDRVIPFNDRKNAVSDRFNDGYPLKVFEYEIEEFKVLFKKFGVLI